MIRSFIEEKTHLTQRKNNGNWKENHHINIVVKGGKPVENFKCPEVILNNDED